jgi:pimeloyl-ACP methyl ester carboxylesterase
MLDNIMVCWLTGTAGTATWLYRGVTSSETVPCPGPASRRRPASPPSRQTPPPPKEWIERSFNLRHHTLMPKGGHFAALEEPELLVEDIRAFFRPLRFGAAND